MNNSVEYPAGAKSVSFDRLKLHDRLNLTFRGGKVLLVEIIRIDIDPRRRGCMDTIRARILRQENFYEVIPSDIDEIDLYGSAYPDDIGGWCLLWGVLTEGHSIHGFYENDGGEGYGFWPELRRFQIEDHE